MSNVYLRCGGCDYEFSLPSSVEEPTKQACPQCAGTEIYQRFGVVNTKCIDAMKECSACPFENNCAA